MTEGSEHEMFGQFPVYGIPMSELASSHPDVVRILQKADRKEAVALFAGLLTLPKLQSCCIRLEALVHLAVRFATGAKPIGAVAAAEVFQQIGSGICGRHEDLPEDVFAASVITPDGDFRHIEGIWESATFYLQRVVELLKSVPKDGGWLILHTSTLALLRISEEVCRRSGYGRYELANDADVDFGLSDEVIAEIQSRVVFSEEQLRELGVEIADLDVFIFSPVLTRVLDHIGLQHSPLHSHPILKFGDQYVVALPTAISVAIRQFIVGGMIGAGQRNAVVSLLSQEYSRLFGNTASLGIGHEPQIHFRQEQDGALAEYGAEVEPGRYAHFVFWMDGLHGFYEEGLNGAFSIGSLIDRTKASTANFRQCMEESGPVREGVTFLVMCGVGRGCVPMTRAEIFSSTEHWSTICISAPDLETLTLLERRLPTVLALRQSELLLRERGVRLVNLSGPLNLLAQAEAQNGHLVPHSELDVAPNTPIDLMLPTNALLDLRQERCVKAQRRSIALPSGELVKVRKESSSLFSDDQHYPHFVSEEWSDDFGLRMVYAGEKVTLWAECPKPHSHERYMMLHTWLPRIGETLENDAVASGIGCMLFRVQFAEQQVLVKPADEPTVKSIDESITVIWNRQLRTIEITVGEQFDHGLALEENFSESLLVYRMLEGVLAAAGQLQPEVIDRLHRVIVPNGDARYGHVFCARHFRDFVRESIPPKPLRLEPIYDASLRLGLGWKHRSELDGPQVIGKVPCCSYLNEVVRGLLDELCQSLRQFNRESLTRLLLLSHESAMIVQERWRKTSRANLGLRPDRQAAIETIVRNEMENNAVLLGSRVLIEFAICECPENGGQTPGNTDASQLLSQLLLAINYGGWSDAIYYDAMEPSLTIRPLGDIHGSLNFIFQVVEPFGHTAGKAFIQDSVAKYSRNFREPDVTSEVTLEQGFLDAFFSETGLRVDDCRRVADVLEDEGIGRKSVIFEASDVELKALLESACVDWRVVLTNFSLSPRASWRDVPEGKRDKDFWPWRYRRRMSLISRPLVQLGTSSNGKYLVAPGLFRDAISHTVHCYYEGSFPHWQLHSLEMKEWAGRAADERGRQFAKSVSELLQKKGWKTRSEVQVRTILSDREAERYGDVDVIAVSQDDKKVVLLECKHLHFHKTVGELAEQLQDYRGERRGKKRDDMLKHIERTELLRSQPKTLMNFLRLSVEPHVESWVVFRHPVPMLHSRQVDESGIGVCTFDNLLEKLAAVS